MSDARLITAVHQYWLQNPADGQWYTVQAEEVRPAISDLVERLRDSVTASGGVDTSAALLLAAADRIEALEAALQEIDVIATADPEMVHILARRALQPPVSDND